LITLHYQTIRRSLSYGSILLMLSFVLPMFVQIPWVAVVCELLFVVLIVSCVGCGLAVSILRKLGKLHWIYTGQDRSSYLLSMERLHQQMKAVQMKAVRDARNAWRQ
jgi:hypothetical protein